MVATTAIAEDVGVEGRRRILAGAEAAAAVRRGIIRATRDLERWSHGAEWPCDVGCENLLQIRVAEEIATLLALHDLGPLRLEGRVSIVSEGGTSKLGRRVALLSDQQRADIAILSKAENVYAIIELKRKNDLGEWSKDLRKVRALLNRYGRNHGNHLRYGVVGAYLSAPTLLKLEARKARFSNLVERLEGRGKPVFERALNYNDEGGPEDYHFTAATVLMTP